MSEPRHYERCAECRRRVMLPRWVDGDLYAGDTGAEWYCMDCSGETSTERIEWARDEAPDRWDKARDNLGISDPASTPDD